MAAEKKEKETSKPGVIDTIFNLLREKGPITKDQILAELAKKFPERKEDSMKATINVQLPSRMARERGVKIEHTDKGYVIKNGPGAKPAPKEKRANKKKAPKKAESQSSTAK